VRQCEEAITQRQSDLESHMTNPNGGSNYGESAAILGTPVDVGRLARVIEAAKEWLFP